MKKITFIGSIFSFVLLSACGKLEMKQSVKTSSNEEKITSYSEVVETPVDTLDEIQSMEFVPTQKVSNRGGVSDITPFLGPIVNLGMIAWDVIKSNKPSVSTNNQYANALPSGAKGSMDLTGFSDLQTSSYRIYGTNPYGATVYDVTYTLVHRYGGKYQNKGQYLENVTIIPSRVQVLWGYTFNMDVKSSNPVNAGTEQNPIAELSLEMKYTVSTLLKAIEKHKLFTFRGDSKDASQAAALGNQIVKN